MAAQRPDPESEVHLARDQFTARTDALTSPDQDEAIKAAHALGDSGDSRALAPLLTLLKTTSNQHVRNAAAIGLKNLGDRRAVPALLAAIDDPANKRRRATLVGALEPFATASMLPRLVELVITGETFEVQWRAFMVIEDMPPGIDRALLAKCHRRVQHAMSNASDDDRQKLDDLSALLFELR